ARVVRRIELARSRGDLVLVGTRRDADLVGWQPPASACGRSPLAAAGCGRAGRGRAAATIPVVVTTAAEERDARETRHTETRAAQRSASGDGATAPVIPACSHLAPPVPLPGEAPVDAGRDITSTRAVYTPFVIHESI